jgi:hypothetical protein
MKKRSIKFGISYTASQLIRDDTMELRVIVSYEDKST